MPDSTGNSDTPTGLALMDVVDLFRAALGIVRWRTHGELGITLVKADLHLKLEWKRELKVGGEFICHLIPVEVGASRESTTTHDLTLSLVPTAGAADLGKPETEELADAIIDLAAAALEIRKRVAKDFDLGSFGIAVDVGVSREGKLQVIAGYRRASATSHTIDLTFRSR